MVSFVSERMVPSVGKVEDASALVFCGCRDWGTLDRWGKIEVSCLTLFAEAEWTVLGAERERGVSALRRAGADDRFSFLRLSLSEADSSHVIS